MALALKLEQAGAPPESVETTATLTLDTDKLSITGIHLDCRAFVPGLDAVRFQEIAEDAKTNCPVSKVLRASISLDAHLDERSGGASS